jgi:transcriptional regulator GlxA family with amidase domain
VRRAQRLLETTDLAIEQVATEAGFGSAAVMREHFGTVVGTNPLSETGARKLKQMKFR